METNLKIIIIIASVIFAIYILSIPYLSSSRRLIVLLFLLQIYSIIVLAKKYNCSVQEKFHFEVSPQREKCLEEQVSLKQPPGVRSKSCCPVTHRGGNLKYVNEWKQKIWARPDSYVDTLNNNVYQTQLPPTGLFVENN